MPDELDGVFEHLEPADFLDAPSLVLKTEPTTFGHADFVDACLDKATFAFYAANGNPNPMAVLASPTGDLIYCPYDEELMGEYMARLNREARINRAIAVFIMKLTSVGVIEVDAEADMPDVGDPEAARKGDKTPGLYFYCETVDGEVIHGFWRIKGSAGKAKLVDLVRIQTTQRNELLHRILQKEV